MPSTSQTAEPNPTTGQPWRRIVGVAAPPFVVALWLSIPALQPPAKVVRGQVEPVTACLVLCSEVVQLGGLLIGCQADLLGAPYACDEGVIRRGEASATFARLPSLAGLVGLDATQGTLLRLERGGRVVYSKSIARHAWDALYGGWLFNAVYWSIAGVVVWLWPRSRFSRRVTWSETH